MELSQPLDFERLRQANPPPPRGRIPFVNAVQTFGQEQVDRLYRELGVSEHPMLRLPTREQVAAAVAGGRQGELIEQLKRRQLRIQLAESQPLQWGWEAETWVDADRLLNDGQYGCYLLGIFGGNRAQKSWYAVKRAVQTADLFPQTRQAIMAEGERPSIATVQVLVWYYLKPRYGHLNGKRDVVYKINYSQSGGFTDGKLVLPNGSEMYFLSYNQEAGDYEGWEFGAPAHTYEKIAEQLRAQGKFVPPNVGVVADESMPLSWLKMFARRLKFRKAKLLWAFTPVKGITPAIKELVGTSATVVESRPSELLPRRNFPDLPEGHMYYVRKCAFPGAMAIYFHTSFNRFGPSPGRTYYDEVKALCEGKESQYVERVAYGYARDSVARAFPKFGPWNIVRREQLPMRRTNYFFTDPAGTRNWASFWVGVAPGNPPSFYIYRDWPDAQTYGEWAIATEREVNDESRKGWDGDIGPAQAGFGYGVTKYKQLFLALERVKLPVEMMAYGGWQMADAWEAAMERGRMDPYQRMLIRRAIRDGADLDSAREEIATRYVDSRAGASEHLAEKGGTCIIEQFEETQADKDGKVIGPSMTLVPASGLNEDEGLTAVNELLDWNQEESLTAVTNQPHLFVCEDCLQARWMFENYTGLGGAKGACKDFADLARYMATANLEYVEEGQVRGKAGKGW